MPMIETCIRCGAEIQQHTGRPKRYCTACRRIRDAAYDAAYRKAYRKRLKAESVAKPANPKPKRSVADLNAAARDHHTTYGKYVAALRLEG
ncbi:MAG: hypothetical protein VB055_06260 [Oscillospiraceae bacterium]|nr:hypothetical protein [Oscillospiraceae bacterium]